MSVDLKITDRIKCIGNNWQMTLIGFTIPTKVTRLDCEGLRIKTIQYSILLT